MKKQKLLTHFFGGFSFVLILNSAKISLLSNICEIKSIPCYDKARSDKFLSVFYVKYNRQFYVLSDVSTSFRSPGMHIMVKRLYINKQP